MANTINPSSIAWEEIKGTPGAPQWLRWHPSQLDQAIAAREAALPEPLTPGEIGELKKYHSAWGADGETLASVEALGRGDARVIVTGQQPGVMAGPMLSLYKAAAAVRLARQLTESHPGRRFVAVFWVASEDHDFNEIRRAYWPGQSGLEEAFIQQSLWKPGQMTGLIETDSFLGGLIKQIEQTTFRTDYRDGVIKLLREAYGGPGATIESGFCRLLLRLLAGSGIVMISPLMPWVRRRGAPLMARELGQPGLSTAAVLERGEAMRGAGVEPPVHRAPDAINGFWVDAQGRRWALHRGDGGMIRRVLSETPEDLPPIRTADLLTELRSDPLCISPNVVTRPIVQDAILPTVAQVVGPGEAAYLAQVEPVYEVFGVFAPVRWPRPEVTLIEPRVERNLDKYGIDLVEAIEHDSDDLMENFLRRELEQGLLHEIEILRSRHRAELGELYQKLGLDVPAMRSAFDKLEQAMEKGFRTIEERILQQRAEDEAHVRRALAVVVASLRPARLPQERALNPIVPFAINYGLDWGRRLLEYIEITPYRPLHFVRMSELSEEENHVDLSQGNL